MGEYRGQTRAPQSHRLHCMGAEQEFWVYLLFLAALGLCCCRQAFCKLQWAWSNLVVAWGLLIVAAFSCCGARALECTGFSSYMWAQQLRFPGSRSWGQQLWCMALVSPQRVGSSRIRDQACVSCIGRRILNHWMTREIPEAIFYTFLWLNRILCLRFPSS